MCRISFLIFVKISFLFLLCFFVGSDVIAGTCPRGLSLTEVLANEEDEHIIFTCRIDSIYSTEEFVKSHFSFATILQSFRGEQSGHKVRISSGTTGITAIGGRILVPGDKYLIIGKKSKIPDIYIAFGCNFLSANISEKMKYGRASWNKEYLNMVEDFFQKQTDKYNGKVVLKTSEESHAVGYFKDGKAEGEWTHYYRGGEEEQIICNYRNGKLHGESKRYWMYPSNSVLQSIQTYKSGELVSADRYLYVKPFNSRLGSSVKYRYKKSKIIERTSFFSDTGEVNGKRKKIILNTTHPPYHHQRISYYHGKYNASHRNINPEKGEYKYGVKVGKWQMFNESGEVDSTVIFPNFKCKKDLFRLYFPSGKINLSGTIENGEKIGKWTEYSGNDNHHIKQIFYYKQDFLEGERQEFYWTENILRKTSPYRNGLLHGDVKTYRKDGSISEIESYQNGLRHGERIRWHASDSIKFKQFYQDGMPIGTWFSYDENGVLQLEKSYQSGRLHGQYTTYDKAGKVKLTGVYEEGEAIGKWTKYEEDGKYMICKPYPSPWFDPNIMQFLSESECEYFTADGERIKK